MGNLYEKYVWEVPVRVTHWVNVISIIVLWATGSPNPQQSSGCIILGDIDVPAAETGKIGRAETAA
jgi:cytochrome b